MLLTTGASKSSTFLTKEPPASWRFFYLKGKRQHSLTATFALQKKQSCGTDPKSCGTDRQIAGIKNPADLDLRGFRMWRPKPESNRRGRICNPSRKSFKTVVCSLLGVPLIGVFQLSTARILSMVCLGLWTQKISLLPLSATGASQAEVGQKRTL